MQGDFYMALQQNITAIKYNKINDFFINIKDKIYANIKGEALSIQAYGKAGQRLSSDIDILLPRTELYDFEKKLKLYDFSSTLQSRTDKIIMLSSSHQIAPWEKRIMPWGKIFIDLNFDIFWGEYTGKRIDIDVFLSDTIEINIYGCKIKTLPPLKAMIQLILHHYKDMNSIFLLATRKSIKYDMFKDLYYLLKNNLDEITLDKLYAISSEYEIIPYVFYLLYYTGLLFKDEILDKYIAAFKTSEGEALLNCYGLNESERREWKCDFQTRLECNNLYDLIKNDLTEKDLRKIEINKKVFLGE